MVCIPGGLEVLPSTLFPLGRYLEQNLYSYSVCHVHVSFVVCIVLAVMLYVQTPLCTLIA